MTNPAQRGAALAKLHIAKKEMNMSDDAYRSLLVRHGAPAADPSARNLQIKQIDAALQEMIGKGWQPKRRIGAGKKLSPQTSHKQPGEATKADALRAVWISMAKAGYLRDRSDNALLAWVRKQSACAGKPIDAIEWINQDDTLANTLLHRLKGWRKRLQTMAAKGVH
ncbi:regulatory protein GemA [Oceanobacter mangrovi]|uniref:regulatory protein GemA n=1 Tax=Oceanobacter mangrovi TaxID=2862510 RepID=UPI001C8E7BAD|nr:regulatory protein GemA [Oceanobacter mangrovi]